MSIRQLCHDTRIPSMALFLFPKELKTGIASTQHINDKNTTLQVGKLVSVNWQGKQVQAEILALSGKSINDL